MHMMKYWTKKAVVLVAAIPLLTGAAVSVASAMPIDPHPASAVEGSSSLLLQAQVGQHTQYPGSNKPAAKAARAKRNAPRYVCDKTPERCQ